MASTHYTLSSLLTLHRIPVSSKRHRQNHLRPKILKTLTKPPLLPSPSPPQPVICPQENNNLCVEIPADETLPGDIAGESENLEVLQVSEAGESENLEVLRVSETTAKKNGVFENVSAADLFKYGGMYFLGAFVLQTIYTVWVMGNYYSNKKDGDLEIDGREKRNILFNGNGKTVSLPVNGANNVKEQLGMEKQIEEIKLMAREVRRIELEKKGEEDEDEDGDEDFEMDGEDAISSQRLGIEKEIGERLLKLQNQINGTTKYISAALKINTRGNSVAGVDKGVNKNVNKGNETLVFKKKFKFKSPSTKATKTPKGFPGTQNWKASNEKKRDSAGEVASQDYGSVDANQTQMLHEDKQVKQQDVVMPKSISGVPSEERGKIVDGKSKVKNHGKNLKEKTEKPNIKMEDGVKTRSTNNGAVQETNFGMSSLEGIQSNKSRKSSIQNFQGFVKENQDADTSIGKDVVLSINGSSNDGLSKNNSAANKVGVKQANAKTDMWWLNLRYVFVILMQRASGEGSTGLYSLKFTSKEQDQSDDSHTVAFEDHADANNFCFILESFFKDLGSFSADAIPMSMQEINEEIISRDKKVVVVKKRQLQLYAGQPLADVEMALCSIIEQDQNAP